MKKLLLGTVGLLALGLSSASAADLPARAYVPAPVAAAVYNWTGMYVGVNGGYGWGDQDPLVLFSNRLDRSSVSIKGGMFGGTMGAQIQQGYVVLGFEGDLDWANITGNAITTPSILGVGQGVTLNTSTKMSAVKTAKTQINVAMNNWLFYATGGVASVKSSATGTSVAGLPCGTLFGAFSNCSSSSWRPGIAAGLGFEYGFTPNWSLKAEYIYLKTVGTGVSTDNLNTIRGGINYRF